MSKVHVKPARDLRNNYSSIRKLLDDHDQVIITNNGRGESVLINIDDYADYEEYLHTRYINEKLDEAIKEAEDPNTKWVSHEEFMEMLKEYL